MDPDSVNPDPKHCHKSGHKIGAGQKVGTYYQIKLALGLTISLGIYFTILQGLQYNEARFTFVERVDLF